MATPEEIRRRVEQTDTARSARRATAAQQIGQLAQRRAAILDQLQNVERELGDVLTTAQDVIGVDELAEFTDLKPADLTAWLAGHKAGRGKRRKATTTSNAHRRTGSGKPATPGQAASTARLSAAGAQAVPERPVTQAS